MCTRLQHNYRAPFEAIGRTICHAAALDAACLLFSTCTWQLNECTAASRGGRHTMFDSAGCSRPAGITAACGITRNDHPALLTHAAHPKNSIPSQLPGSVLHNTYPGTNTLSTVGAARTAGPSTAMRAPGTSTGRPPPSQMGRMMTGVSSACKSSVSTQWVA